MSPELVLLIVEAGTELVKALIAAFAKGDTSVLQKPVHEILPTPLLTTLAKKAADEAAKAKFGS